MTLDPDGRLWSSKRLVMAPDGQLEERDIVVVAYSGPAAARALRAVVADAFDKNAPRAARGGMHPRSLLPAPSVE